MFYLHQLQFQSPVGSLTLSELEKYTHFDFPLFDF